MKKSELRKIIREEILKEGIFNVRLKKGKVVSVYNSKLGKTVKMTALENSYVTYEGGKKWEGKDYWDETTAKPSHVRSTDVFTIKFNTNKNRWEFK